MEIVQFQVLIFSKTGYFSGQIKKPSTYSSTIYQVRFDIILQYHLDQNRREIINVVS